MSYEKYETQAPYGGMQQPGYPMPPPGGPSMYPVATIQPQMMAQPGSQITIQRRKFTHELCDCCGDMSECCCAFFLPCCYEIQLFNKADEGICSCLYGGIVPLRTKIRTERGIEGNICNDFCTLVWCGFCAMVQMGRELKATEPVIKLV